MANHLITHTLSNISVEGGRSTLTLSANEGYVLPDSITVTNGTLVSWDKDTGVAIIEGDDTTTISCECTTATPSGHSISLKNTYTEGAYFGSELQVTINNIVYGITSEILDADGIADGSLANVSWVEEIASGGGSYYEVYLDGTRVHYGLANDGGYDFTITSNTEIVIFDSCKVDIRTNATLSPILHVYMRANNNYSNNLAYLFNGIRYYADPSITTEFSARSIGCARKNTYQNTQAKVAADVYTDTTKTTKVDTYYGPNVGFLSYSVLDLTSYLEDDYCVQTV